MLQKFFNRFVVSQLDNGYCCSSLLIKQMGPKIVAHHSDESGVRALPSTMTVDISDRNVFFQMFDNLFVEIQNSYGNTVTHFAQGVGNTGYKPYMYGFFIFYCAHAQIDTTGKLLESFGCSVQKTHATKTHHDVALYVIESGKFLDLYEDWLREVTEAGYKPFGSFRTEKEKKVANREAT